MALYKLRIELRDSPGQLGRMSSAIGVAGGNIEAIDIQEVNGDVVIDEVVIRLAANRPIDAVRRELLDAGAISVLSTATDRQLPVDGVVNALAVASSIASAGDWEAAVDAFEAGLPRLVPATSVRLTETRHVMDHPLLCRVLTGSDAVTERTTDMPTILPPVDRPVWVLGVMDPLAGGLVAVLTRMMNIRFSGAEAERVRGLLRVVAHHRAAAVAA